MHDHDAADGGKRSTAPAAPVPGGARRSADPRPQPPPEPDPEDCCGEGCVPCVYDTYEAKLERYRDNLAAWRGRHPGEATHET